MSEGANASPADPQMMASIVSPNALRRYQQRIQSLQQAGGVETTLPTHTPPATAMPGFQGNNRAGNKRDTDESRAGRPNSGSGRVHKKTTASTVSTPSVLAAGGDDKDPPNTEELEEKALQAVRRLKQHINERDKTNKTTPDVLVEQAIDSLGIKDRERITLSSKATIVAPPIDFIDVWSCVVGCRVIIKSGPDAGHEGEITSISDRPGYFRISGIDGNHVGSSNLAGLLDEKGKNARKVLIENGRRTKIHFVESFKDATIDMSWTKKQGYRSTLGVISSFIGQTDECKKSNTVLFRPYLGHFSAIIGEEKQREADEWLSDRFQSWAQDFWDENGRLATKMEIERELERLQVSFQSKPIRCKHICTTNCL